MTEDEARAVVLLHALETERPVPPAWSAEDARDATAQALARLGRHAPAERVVAERAMVAVRRLGERDRRWTSLALARFPAVRSALVLALAAMVAGAAIDAIGGRGRFDLLAPPLLGVVAWNAVVYVLIVVALLWRFARGLTRHGVHRPATSGGPVARAVAAAVARLHRRRLQRASATQAPAAGPTPSVVARFVAGWSALTWPIQQRRVAAALHLGAAALALGAIGSIYARGVATDFRAGWDSTFLEPAHVEQAVRVVLGPAARVLPTDLPDAARLASWRFAENPRGMPAARWIHLWAITLVGFVVLPRMALSGWNAWRAASRSRDLLPPLPQDYTDPIVRTAPPDAPPTARPATVLPYAVALDERQRAGLAGALAGVFGAGTAPQLAPALRQGDEERLGARLPGLAGPTAALFALTATPERETHVALMRALGAALPPGSRLAALVDESTFRRHFHGAPDLGARLDQRRDAWRDAFAQAGLPAPHFVDLLDPGRAA